MANEIDRACDEIEGALHDEIARLKAECAALAADNARLKEAAKGVLNWMNSLPGEQNMAQFHARNGIVNALFSSPSPAVERVLAAVKLARNAPEWIGGFCPVCTRGYGLGHTDECAMAAYRDACKGESRE